MTTVVNNPAPQAPLQEKENKGGAGFLIGVIILVVFLGIVLYFAIPAIKNMGPIQLNIPAINVSAPQVNIPNNVNVTTGTTPTK